MASFIAKKTETEEVLGIVFEEKQDLNVEGRIVLQVAIDEVPKTKTTSTVVRITDNDSIEGTIVRSRNQEVNFD